MVHFAIIHSLNDVHDNPMNHGFSWENLNRNHRFSHEDHGVMGLSGQNFPKKTNSLKVAGAGHFAQGLCRGCTEFVGQGPRSVDRRAVVVEQVGLHMDVSMGVPQ